MNAPENTPAAYPINLAHEVLLKSDDAMCVDEVARAIIGKKPTKADIKPVAKLLKELADLGLIEMEPRAGGVPFYRLIVASESLPTKTYPPETLRAMIADLEAEKAGDTRSEFSLLGVIADIRAAIGDTGQIMLGDLAAHIQRDIGELIESLEVEKRVSGSAISAVAHICEHLGCDDHNGHVPVLRAIDALRAQITSLTTDVTNTRRALSDALNEANRLRAELATERQAREALQEQDGVDVKDAAVGYLIRVTKRKPRYVTQPERARDAALAAVRAGAGRAEVLAVVPVGVARRGAEWQASEIGG
mgnify:FL=1